MASVKGFWEGVKDFGKDYAERMSCNASIQGSAYKGIDRETEQASNFKGALRKRYDKNIKEDTEAANAISDGGTRKSRYKVLADIADHNGEGKYKNVIRATGDYYSGAGVDGRSNLTAAARIGTTGAVVAAFLWRTLYKKSRHQV